MRLTALSTLLACLLLLSGSAIATNEASYPERPVTVVVPYAAGGPMDKLARQLAEQLKTSLGQPVVIHNQAGAGGNIGVAAVKRAAPDGYTLLLNHVHMATAPALYRQLDFRPDVDFEPLGVIAESSLVLVSRPGVPSASVAEFRQWSAKQRQVTIANAGPGSASHLCGLLLQQAMRLKMTAVPYRGTGPAMLDMLGGQIDLMCDLTANAVPQIAAGKLRAVALTSAQPMAGGTLAGIPTMRAFGIPNLELSIWYGLYAPRNAPRPVVQRLSAGLAKAVQDPQFRRQQVEAGVTVVEDERLSPADHGRHLRKELDRWGPVIRASGEYAE